VGLWEQGNIGSISLWVVFASWKIDVFFWEKYFSPFYVKDFRGVNKGEE
jgi:hypothetical protein